MKADVLSKVLNYPVSLVARNGGWYVVRTSKKFATKTEATSAARLIKAGYDPQPQPKRRVRTTPLTIEHEETIP